MNQAVDVDSLVYSNEKSLFLVLAVLSAIFWVLLVVGTVGIALIYALLFFIGYLFAQSGLIAWIKGNGVRLDAEQFPDLYQRYQQCCLRLGMTPCPDAYLINGGGLLNAFATRFLGRNFVVLYSNVVDALAEHPEAINFYLGHELGHLKRKHLQWGAFLAPAGILPLVGAAYSRAREYTCDQHGLACCSEPESALRGMAALAAGDKRWSSLNLEAYLRQAQDTRGFWMSFHELIADYPWLVKRAARIESTSYRAPGRNPLAWLLALFVPRLGFGGGAAGTLIVVAMIGIMAAIAIPAYKDYEVRAKAAAMARTAAPGNATSSTAELDEVVIQTERARQAVMRYAYANNLAVPASLAEAGYMMPAGLPVDSFAVGKGGVLSVRLAFDPLRGAELTYIPQLDEEQHIVWHCSATGFPQGMAPADCK